MQELCRRVLLALCAMTCAPDLGAATRDLQAEDARTLYALGVALAESVSRFQLTESELELVEQGLTDGVLNRACVRYADHGEQVDALAKERLEQAFEARERLGAEFRSQVLVNYPNASLTESGAILIPLRVGSGTPPRLTDMVQIAYTASLADGTVFDQTQAGESLTVPIESAAIPCLREGLQKMRPSAVYRMVCPPAKGFYHPAVEPGSTLVYEIELLRVVDPAREEDDQ